MSLIKKIYGKIYEIKRKHSNFLVCKLAQN